MMGRKKAMKRLYDDSRKLSKRRKYLNEILECTYGLERQMLMCTLAEDERLDERLRVSLLIALEKIPSQESVRVLRRYVHGKHYARVLRSAALESLSLHGDPLLHVDLMSLLSDPSEETWLRADVVEKIGGLGLRRAQGLIQSILEDNRDDERILFWCLYACVTMKPDKALKKVVKRYLKDERELDPGMQGHVKSKVTLASEARWVWLKWQGLNTEPGWALTAKENEEQESVIREFKKSLKKK